MKKAYVLVLFILAAQISFSQELSLAERIRNKEQKTQIESKLFNPGYSPMSQPEQECNSAIPVCQYTYTQSNSYSGYGNNQEIPTNSSCLGSDEKNSVWYVFTVQAGGTLDFDITPNQSSDDYDFALYDITGQNCSAISNGSISPVRCNFSATAGTTGLDPSASNASEPASGPNQSTTLNVTTGQTYVLIVSNYSSTQYGYTLNFSNAAGSANIFDNVPPSSTSVTATCGSNIITMNLSEPVLCSSVTAGGTEFTVTGTGGPYTVTAASGVNCGTATSQVSITLNSALTGAGPWTLNYANGTDGNVMIDNCGNLMNAGSVNFTLSPTTASITGPSTICNGQTAGLTASNGNSWSWTGPGGFTSTSQSISVSPTTTGTYSVTVNYGSCGNSGATHAVTVKASPTAGFTAAPNPACVGTAVNFTNTSVMAQTCMTFGLPSGSPCPCSFPQSCGTPPSTGTFVSYQWSFGDGGTSFYVFGSGAFSPSHTYSAPGTYQVTLNASDNFSGCSNTINQTITVLPAVGPLTASNDTTICPGQSATLNVSGGSTYSWTSTPAGFTSTNASVTVTPTVTTTYNVSSPGCSGSITEQVVVTVGGVPPTTSAITGPASVCPNATAVVFSVTNTPGSTYNWTVPAGATITAGQGTNSITVNFGASGGTVSVTETASCGVGSPVSTTIATNAAPVTSAITGPSPVCPNATGIVYSVTNTAGSTYAWTVPAGATIASGQGTNSITVNFGATGGTISVAETSSCGTGTPVSTTVATSSTPVTSAITGPSPVCPNATGIVYSVTNTAGSTYGWTVPAGATIASGQGTNSITVNFGASGGTIDVTETSSCGTGTPVSITVTTSSTPITSSITGPATVCPNATGMVFSVTNTAGSTYAWTVPAGATITAGQGTNSITVNFGAGGGTVSVTETSTCGSGAPVSTAVAVSATPITSSITGSTTLCPNASGVVFSVTNTVGSTYAWTVPAGATITSGQGTNSINVAFGATGGTVSVTETNSCGTGTPVSITVNMGTAPVTSSITGTTPLCVNATGNAYSVTNTAGSTYAWTVPAGATITAGQGTNSITVDFGATGGVISVTETASCGSGTPVTFGVTLNGPPATPVISGPSTVCENSAANAYSVVNNPPNTYSWATTGGLTIASGQGTTSITASAGSTNGTITVTETGTCGTATATANITTTVVAITITPAQDSICNGYSTTLVASGASSYLWTPSIGLSSSSTPTVTASPSATTTYSITGTSGTCTGTATVVITLRPNLVITPVATSTTVCSGSSTNISVSGATNYTWTPGTGLNTTTGNAVVATPTVTTTYSISGTTATCSGSATITVTVTTVPTLSLTPANPTICFGANVTINASGATSYAWAPNTNFTSNNPANSSVTVNPPTTTTYTVIGSSGSCNNSTSVLVTVLPQIIADAGINDTICEGDLVQLSGTGGTDFDWAPPLSVSDPSLANPTTSPTVTTTYTLTVSNAGLCPSTDQVTVFVNPAPTVYAGADTSINIEESVVLNGSTNGSVYSWANDGTLSCNVCLSPVATPTNTTTYTLSAFNIYGCKASDEVTIDVIKDYAFYVPNSFTPNGDELNEIFKVEGFGIEKIEMYVYDRWGNRVFETKEWGKGWNGEFKGKTVQEDVYIYHFKLRTYSGVNVKRTGHVTVVR